MILAFVNDADRLVMNVDGKEEAAEKIRGKILTVS